MKIQQVEFSPENLATTVRLRHEAAAWLAAHGQDQWVHDWPDTETMVAGFARDLRAGTTWFATDNDGTVLATVTISRHTNPGLWTADEEASAIFVHRLTISRQATGQGIGGRLLDFAGERAVQDGLQWVRLDAWTTNKKLHAYYLTQGFRLVRIVPHYPRPSAACFEREVGERPARSQWKVSD